jgi:Trk K+ transport system NAD-binding subunit
MGKVRRRAKYYILSIAVLVVISSVVYDTAMRLFEPQPYPPEGVEISILHSMQVVVETFTATGYGSDSPWLSPEMNVIVMILDLTGVALFFVALPAVLLPLFRESLSPSPPTEIEDDLSGHVIICTYTERAESLITELRSREVPYILVEPDPDRALSLQEDGYEVAHANPESASDLQRLNLGAARALVADVSDRVDASIVLAAREADGDLKVVSVVEDPEHKPYHELAGADQVLTPRQLLGDGLAQKLTVGVSTDHGGASELGTGFDIMEVPVGSKGRLTGKTLAESDIREQFGVNVIGAWSDGEFEAPPSPQRRLERGTVLLVTGTESQLQSLSSAVATTVRRFRQGETVVVGHGEVGRTVTETLDEAGVSYTVVDQNDSEAVDVVGDASDRETLEAAGVPNARSVVLAIPDDTTTEFATLAVGSLNESGQIIARADDAEAVRKTYRAGADYVLSLATVTGRSVASAVIEDEEVISVGSTVEIVRTEAPALAGQTLREAAIRERTDATVVAVEREGTFLTELTAEFVIKPDDVLVVAGSNQAIQEFMGHAKA